MAKQGKCLSCETHMPWGTPVCPGCGLVLRWPERPTGTFRVFRAGLLMTVIVWGLPVAFVCWIIGAFVLGLAWSPTAAFIGSGILFGGIYLASVIAVFLGGWRSAPAPVTIRTPMATTTSTGPVRRGIPPGMSIADELAKLDSLRERGLLTEDEFAAQKSKMLGG
jgi:hypothetical protein